MPSQTPPIHTLHRVSRRLSDAEGRHGGAGDAITLSIVTDTMPLEGHMLVLDNVHGNTCKVKGN